MQAEHDAQAADERETLHNDQTLILEELKALRAEVRALRSDGKDAVSPAGNASTA